MSSKPRHFFIFFLALESFLFHEGNDEDEDEVIGLWIYCIVVQVIIKKESIIIFVVPRII